MPDWLTDFLGGFSINLANAIWNKAMGLISGMLATSPQAFSTGAWGFVENTLYPWALSIGVGMLNLFFIIAMLQAVSDFSHNITLEMAIEALIKIAAANVIFLNLLKLIKLLFLAASLMAGDVFTLNAPDLIVEDMDLGSVLFYHLFGIFFVLAAVVCSFLMLLTVYGRYIRLYLLVVMAPFAVPALIGGRGVERSFYAWVKTFLLNAFEIVVIALVMAVSFKISSSGITIFDGHSMAASAVDGFWDALNALFTMILMTASVKGANSLLQRAFGL